jgi:hypothetical protein
MNQQVPVLVLQIEYRQVKGEIDEAVHRASDSGHFRLGDEVEAFEHEVPAIRAFGIATRAVASDGVLRVSTANAVSEGTGGNRPEWSR